MRYSVHDRATQTLRSQIAVVRETGTKLYPVRIRYAWPSELDLMAELAGLRLVERSGGWRQEPFTSTSSGHVSIYAASAS